MEIELEYNRNNHNVKLRGENGLVKLAVKRHNINAAHPHMERKYEYQLWRGNARVGEITKFNGKTCTCNVDETLLAVGVAAN